MAGYFIKYAVETRPNTSSALGVKFLASAQGAFVVGRFSGTSIMKFVRPRWVILAYLSAVIVFVSASTTQGNNIGVSMLYLTLFFGSVCFPTIVALGIRGLGKRTKKGRLQFMVGACTYALAVNFVPSYHVIADKIGDVGIKHAPDEEKAVHDDEWEEKAPGEAVVERKFKLNMKGYVLNK